MTTASTTPDAPTCPVGPDRQEMLAERFRQERDLLRHHWRRLPLLLRLGLLALPLALLATAVVTQVVLHQGYRTTAFAVPAVGHGSVRWQARVDRFGHKVSRAFGVHQSTAREFAPWILEASQRQKLEPELLASLVLTESSFRKNVRSHVGAVGPAQVRPEFWSGFCGTSSLALDPAENIYCGAQVLSHLAERCGDTACALQAYNVGMHSNRARAGERYVTKIDAHLARLRTQAL